MKQTQPVALSCQQIRSIDRRAIEEYGMSGLVLMENAGRGCVDVLEQLRVEGPVVVCCGKGNNAGDGFVIARHLDLRGFAVKVCLWCQPSELSPDARVNFEILAKSGVPICRLEGGGDELNAELRGADWIVDALLGTGAKGEPRPPLDQIIETINAQTGRKLAVDLPSGLDGDSGAAAAATIRAEHTCTFVAAKTGFTSPTAAPYLGQLHVLDIGAPRKLIKEYF